MRRTGTAIGGVYLLVPETKMLHLAVLRGAPPEFFGPWLRTPVDVGIPIADAVRFNRPVSVTGLEAMARDYPRVALVLPYPFSLVAAPINGGKRCWGSLFLIWPAERTSEFIRRERGHVLAAAQRMANALDAAERDGVEPRPPERPRMLSGAGELTPTSASDFAERLPGGCASLDLEGRFTYVSATASALLGRSSGDLLGATLWQGLPWLDDPTYEDHYRAAVFSRKPVAMTAHRPPDLWLRLVMYPGETGISIRVDREKPEVDDAVTEAPGTAAARSDRPPGDAPPRPAGQLYRLMHLATVLTEAASVAEVIDRVADEILPAFDAQGLVIYHFADGRLRVAGHRGYDAGYLMSRFDDIAADTAITQPGTQTLFSGVPVFFSSREEMRRTYPDLELVSGKHAWAILPLIVSGRPIGSCVLAYEHPHDFPVAERAIMSAIASVIAQALDRARLFDAKHKIAHDLQEALLPRVLPDVPGVRVLARYLPATRGMNIGGDFYDLIKLGPQWSAAVIGDVQGHNVAAAALMGQVRTAIHAHTAAGTPPDEVLARTNRLLIDLDTNLFASCLYARLDLARNRICFANAGHPPPLLWVPGSYARVLDVRPGLLLGVDAEAAYPLTEVDLPPGAVLVFYTDGLVEAPRTDIDRAIGAVAEALERTPGPDLEDVADSLLREARERGRHTDDVALLLVQVSR
ncbi:SpoIIE family protein phosphatase [Yinghuangia sp. ASG 101]|nr:SpoIIE family protein phosphatase [Yinghuangia sp. ASG 101]UGQ15304.1 SpoIIE family protein phosphatase [Yinghuangia sp. ASG 101]